MIDWTKPVETAETPPRPVRVLCTDAGGSHPVVVLIDDYCHRAPMNGVFKYVKFQLRNVAHKPVLHERWVNLYDTYTGSLYCSEKRANSEAGKGRVECRRIAWNSDGSPVDDSLMLANRVLTAKAEALQAEVDRMKPVVDAAVAGVDSFNRRGLLRLIEAVRAYQGQQPAERAEADLAAARAALRDPDLTYGSFSHKWNAKHAAAIAAARAEKESK